MATPAACPDAVCLKVEQVDYLVTEQRVVGERSYPLASFALASLKPDILSIGLTKN
jgi:hypothetical protein